MLKVDEILGTEIIELNNKNLDDLKERVNKNQVSWVLGAGISKSVGVPLWRECLLKMWARILMLEKDDGADDTFQLEFDKVKKGDKNKNVLLSKINEMIRGRRTSEALNGIDTLESAEYLKNLVATTADEQKFNIAYFSLLKDALLIKDKNNKDIFKGLKDQVIGILAEYFSKKVANNKITVVTYNFDDLLEFALDKFGVNKSQCYIKNPDTSNAWENKNGIHIYHPHGTISVVDNSISEESYKVVLAESDYRELEQKAYIWENSIQAKILHDSSCVFLGFSGEDYNFRRILKNMESGKDKQENSHYMFISIQSFVKDLFEDEVYRRLLGDEKRSEEERKEYIANITKTDYDVTLRQILNDPTMVYEKMLMLKKLQAQYWYWGNRNIIPIWTTREELSGMVKYIL